MGRQLLLIKLLLMILAVQIVIADYSVQITNNGPVVSGAAVQFVAKVMDGDSLASGSFRFDWKDDAIPHHFRSVESKDPYDSWVVNYTSKYYPPGPYVMQVSVFKYIFLIPYRITSDRNPFTLTETLNGEMKLTQYGKPVDNEFVSNESSLVHEITLHKSDQEYLNDSATSVLTYWFVDCKYFGMTDDYRFVMNFTETEKRHKVEALVLANFDPLPTPVPTTTTPAPTTSTTPAPNVTTTTTTTTAQPTTTVKSVRPKRNVITNFSDSTTEIVAKIHGEFHPINGTAPYNDSVQFICSNHTIIPLGPNITYGYFSRKVYIKQPVSNITAIGNNWLQHGEILNLTITCKGSSIFHYCYKFMDGVYNVTGNETCLEPDVSEKCHFPINWLFIKPDINVYTAVVIIYNDVSTAVYQNTITIYKVNKQAQLSVIVVPVAFSMVAVVLIVFGVAYYIQNRTRFIVEIADFNFGQQFGDMEYKTFHERLRDSFSNAFTRVPTPSSSEGPVWPPGRKYGSMT